MNPQGLSTWAESQVSTPKPIGEETLQDLQMGLEISQKTGAWVDDYNECTECFEEQRTETKQESFDARKELGEEIWLLWAIQEKTKDFAISKIAWLYTSINEIARWSDKRTDFLIDSVQFFANIPGLGYLVDDPAVLDAFQEACQKIQNSWENNETKCFQFSKEIRKLCEQIPIFNSSVMREAHDESTREIIKSCIESDDKTLAVWFNENWYYTTQTPNILDDMEVGTYLCSLHKSGELSLTTLSELFSPTQLPGIINKYKNGDFGPTEVRDLFWPYFEGFEEVMEEILAQYISEESDGDKIIGFMNAKYSENTHPIYGNSGIGDLAEKLASTDISWLEDEDLKNEVLDYRRQQAGGRYIAQLSEMYHWDQAIMDMLWPIVMTAVEWVGNDFNFDWVNEAISQYNQKLWSSWEQVPLIEWGILAWIEASVSSLYNANESANWLEESQNQLDEAIALWAARSAELHALQRQFIAAVGQTEINQDLVKDLQEKIEILQWRSFYAQTQIDQAETETDSARIAVDESLEDLDDLLALISNQSNRITEYNDRNSDRVWTESEIDTLYANGSLQWLTQQIRSTEILLYCFEKYPDTFWWIFSENIHQDLQLIPEILISYPWVLYWHDYNKIPASLIEDEDFMVPFITRCISWKSANITSLFYRVMWENSSTLLSTYIQKVWAQNLNHQQVVKLEDNLPNVIRREFGINNISKDTPQNIEEIEVLYNSLTQRDFVWDEIKEIYTKIDDYVQENWLTADTRLREIVRSIILSWNFDSLEFTKYTIGKDISANSDLIYAVIETNLNDIKFLSEEIRKNDDIHEKVIRQIKKSWDISELINIRYLINLAPKTTISLLAELQKSHPNQDIFSMDSWRYQRNFDTFLLQQWQNISEQDFRGLSPDERKIAQDIIQVNIDALDYLQWKLSEDWGLAQSNIREKLNWGNEKDALSSEMLNIFDKYDLQADQRSKIERKLLEWSFNIENSDDFFTELTSVFKTKQERETLVLVLSEIAQIEIQESSRKMVKVSKNITFSDTYSQEFQDCFENGVLNEVKLRKLLNEVTRKNLDISVNDILKQLWWTEINIHLIEYIELHTHMDFIETITDPETVSDVMEHIANWWNAQEYFRQKIREKREAGIWVSLDSEINPPKEKNTKSDVAPKNSEISSIPLYEAGEKEFISSTWEPIAYSNEDLIILKQNPELKEDIIRLHWEFIDTWLERLWKHKDAIFKSIWNNWGFKFNSQDGWYVDTREANELFSTILYVTTENPNYKQTWLSLNETKAAIIRETSGAFGETNVEATWEQWNKLEKSFIDKFTMRNQWDEWRFNYAAFNKALKWDFSSSSQ